MAESRAAVFVVGLIIGLIVGFMLAVYN